MPISRLAEAILGAQEDIAASGLTAPIVGHVGDGNFHTVILVPPEADWAGAGLGAGPEDRGAGAGAWGFVQREHGVGIGKRGRAAGSMGWGSASGVQPLRALVAKAFICAMVASKRPCASAKRRKPTRSTRISGGVGWRANRAMTSSMERVERQVAGSGRLPRGEAGLHRRRGELDHLHPAPQHLAQAQRVGMDRRLGVAVGRRGVQRHEAQARGDVDDRRVGRPARWLDERIDEADRAEGRLVLMVASASAKSRDRSRRLEAHDAGVVDEHVDGRMGSDEAPGEVGDAGGTVDVERERVHVRAPGDGLAQRVLAAAGHDHRVAEIVEAGAPAPRRCRSRRR